MNFVPKTIALICTLWLAASCATTPDKLSDAQTLFQQADQSNTYFSNSYGYALFPTIGKGALVVGGARGAGSVFRNGEVVGESTITKLSAGFQLGGQSYSQIIFFQDQRAFQEFCGGSFEFDATASAVAINASVAASASTSGNSTTQSISKNDADLSGGYHKGTAVFTITKGGVMYEASLGGQKYSTRC